MNIYNTKYIGYTKLNNYYSTIDKILDRIGKNYMINNFKSIYVK